MIPSRCRLCNTQLSERLVHPRITSYNYKLFGYFSCQRCGSANLFPCPQPNDFDSMYGGHEYQDSFYASKMIDRYQSSIDFLLANIPPGSISLLDYGCGSGQFLAAAQKKGIECFGFEYNKDVCEKVSSSYGIPASSDLKLPPSSYPYDVIHLGDVLEHIPDPFACISELIGYLKPNGVLFIEGPLEANWSPVRHSSLLFSFLRKLTGLNKLNKLPPYHLYMATELGQRQFFDRFSCLALQCWQVYDSGWPYAGSQSAVKRFIAGLASVTSGKVILGSTFGNRFKAILRSTAIDGMAF